MTALGARNGNAFSSHSNSQHSRLCEHAPSTAYTSLTAVAAGPVVFFSLAETGRMMEDSEDAARAVWLHRSIRRECNASSDRRGQCRAVAAHCWRAGGGRL